MSLSKNPESGRETPFDADAERARAKAYVDKHNDVLPDLLVALTAKKVVAGSSIVKLARPVWLTVGTNLLEVGQSSEGIKPGLFVDQGTGSCQVTFPLLYCSADEHVVTEMVALIVRWLIQVERLIGELEALKAKGADNTHPEIQGILHIFARLTPAIAASSVSIPVVGP